MINLYRPDFLVVVSREVWINGMRFGIEIEFCRDPDFKFIHYYTRTKWGEDIDGSPLCDKEECSELEGWAETYHKEIDNFIYMHMGDIVEEALELEITNER